MAIQALSSLSVELPSGVDPVAAQLRGKAPRVAAFVALLRAVLGGSRSGRIRIGTAGASAVVTCAAVQAGDTVTVNGQALTAAQHNATGTLTIDNGENFTDGDKFTVGPVQFTAKTTPDTGNTATTGQFAIGASATLSAAAAAAAINAHFALQGLVTAVASGDAFTVRAVTGGTAGNAIVLSEDLDQGAGGAFAVSGAGVLVNGAAVANNQFDMAGTNTQTAAALVAAVLASTTAAVNTIVYATSAAGAVTVRAKMKGTAGNAITLATSNGSRLAITGGVSRLAGGAESSYSFGAVP